MSIISSTATSEAELGDIRLTLRVSPRARRLRLTVDPRSGAVVLVLPRRASRRRALAWAAGQTDWITARLAAIAPERPLAPGATVPLGGLDHVIDWSPELPRRIELGKGRLIAGGPRESLASRLLRWLRGEALALLAAETRELSAKAGVAVSRIGVGDPRSRWGSCSSSGAIRYSWRLILAPDWVRRATVAHEVAHLVHLNHGPDFHALVETLLGDDPAPARAWLRSHGAALHRIG